VTLRGGRLARLLAIPLFGLGALVTLGPMAALDCAEPFLRSLSPDRQHSLTVCPRFRQAAGQTGDGPAWVVLRDVHGRIEGVVDLGLTGSIGRTVQWDQGRVALPLIAEFALPETLASPFPGFVREVGWRLRAAAGMAPSDAEFR
jgi:hypothetical protein